MHSGGEMKKLNCLLLAAVIFCAVPEKGLASENENSGSSWWWGNAKRAFGTLFDYFYGNLPQDSFNPYVYAMSFRKLSWNDWFTRAAEQFSSYFRSDVIDRPFKSLDSAIDLYFLVVANAPRQLYIEYLRKLDASFEQRAREILQGLNKQDKIDYYLDQVLKNSPKEARKEVLEIIYNQLRDNVDSLRKKYQIAGWVVQDIIQETGLALEKLLKKKRFKKEKDIEPVKKEEKTITFKDYIDVPKEAEDFVSRIKNPEKYKNFNLPLPNGILLAGDPGAGKTYLAQAIAGELDCPFFDKKAADFTVEELVGSGKKAVKKIFAEARQAANDQKKSMAIMFIDEFDAIGSRANKSNGDVEVINALLPEIGVIKDGVKVIVMAATNYPNNIDDALKRPGRMDNIIYVKYPSEVGRKKLLEKYLGTTFVKKDINVQDFINKLASVMEDLSPADIVAFVTDAGVIGFDRKKGESGIDYDCAMRALWNIKKARHEKLLPPRPEKEKFVREFLNDHGLKIAFNDLLAQMNTMTLIDIKDAFDKAVQFSQNKQSGKTLQDWLWVALAAQNQLIKINQNRELIHLCEKIYAPLKIQGYDYPEKVADFSSAQKEAILKLQSEDIFNRFEAMEHIRSVVEKAPIVSQPVGKQLDFDEPPLIMQPVEKSSEQDLGGWDQDTPVIGVYD
jgi:SpoVK/Ycf46/Vps4 family AAA+-type ATPase